MYKILNSGIAVVLSIVIIYVWQTNLKVDQITTYMLGDEISTCVKLCYLQYPSTTQFSMADQCSASCASQAQANH